MSKQFMGKLLHADPWETLAKGPREAMASLWEKYLSEVLEASPKSRRVQKLRREIEKAADYSKIFQDWNDLPVEDRARAWKRLIAAAKEREAGLRDACVRCGECCEISSPTLLTADLPLFQREVLTWNEVYTLRAGEQVTGREGQPVVLNEERLKVREVPGSRQCWFYLAATGSCRIYEHRPEQCRRQNCWGEPPPPPLTEELLNRQNLLGQVPEVWELIQAHEARCAASLIVQGLKDLAAGRAEGGDVLFESLHFDHYLRQMLREDWGLSPEAAELLLGRPLPDFLAQHGINAALNPEGVFELSPREK
ncbi:MAG: YkgJ family cysteine cluster protein [Deltaproteobacteria bacterium]|nr:YkgJ family cysteine cluster protein [Deltaproteobacteria bacterium]